MQKVVTVSADTATDVVTCFITRKDKVLLLKRSQQVKTYRGLWAGVSGYLDTEDPVDQAWIELEEEVGIKKEDATLTCIGEPLEILDETQDCRWRVHPIRFSLLPDVAPRLDWESVALLWVFPNEMQSMPTVPGLFDAWQRVSH